MRAATVTAAALALTALVAGPAHAADTDTFSATHAQRLTVPATAAVAPIVRAEAVVARAGLVRPVACAAECITDGFGSRVAPAGASAFHRGADYTPGAGSPVHAVMDGTVAEVHAPGESTYGAYIVIQHADGVSTLYAHLAVGSASVAVGETVTAGQTIAAVGTTGVSTGPHLHFEVRLAGSPVDPEAWLSERAAPLPRA